MVLCGLCRLWQHAVCFALLREEDVPELHVCEQCSSEGEGEGQPCTDAFLQFLSPVALQVRVSVCVGGRGWVRFMKHLNLCVCVWTTSKVALYNPLLSSQNSTLTLRQRVSGGEPYWPAVR